jgi:hypothetical protein
MQKLDIKKNKILRYYFSKSAKGFLAMRCEQNKIQQKQRFTGTSQACKEKVSRDEDCFLFIYMYER